MSPTSFDIESGSNPLCSSSVLAKTKSSAVSLCIKAVVFSIALFCIVSRGIMLSGSVSDDSTLTPPSQLVNLHRELRSPLHFGIADSKQLETREAEVGAKFNTVVKYQSVKTLSYKYLVKPYLDKGREVVLVLEFKSDSYRNLNSIANGDYDGYLNKFIDEVKADGNKRFFIRPLHEFNGDWYSWGTYRGGDNTTENFKRAFRHVAGVFKSRGANVKIQLDYNCSNPREDTKSFYDWFPGEDVVDMILCNAYNRTGVDQWHTKWVSFKDIFSGAYNKMSSLPGYKPLGVGEMSTTGAGDKPQWFRDAFSELAYRFTRVQEADFFLINKGDGSWDLNTDSERKAFGESMAKYKWATY